MLCYLFWKGLIDDIKTGYDDTTFYAFSLLLLIVLTPIGIILDILISPYSLCYLIVKKIQKKEK